MSLSAGTRLGPYEILGLIGAGGMGEVYKARDTRLDRFVALKVLPADISQDADRRARFRREARAIAGLTHPHICTLFDVGEYDGATFLVLEYLDGTTLKQAAGGRPLPTETLTELALQITEALQAAHAKGIVHRDIKPANIVITQDRQATVLDFGLAKIVRRETAADDETAMLEHVTAPTSTLGTVAYMSPEQILGKDVDARTDLFSFGVVLYEMATGTLPFRGDTAGAVFDAILGACAPPASG